MKVQDAFRAQYFLDFIETELKEIEEALRVLDFFDSSILDILQGFVEPLYQELDQIILPTIVYEIDVNRPNLRGNSPKKRYESFFINERGFTSQARTLLKRYPLLEQYIKNLIQQSFDSLLMSINRFRENKAELTEWLAKDLRIQKILPLRGADRHGCQQALLFVFSSDFKIIYKPVDLRPDLLFARFTEKLKLEFPFNLKGLEIRSYKNYGWIKYIEKNGCFQKQDIENFYRRAGVLLGIADALNYTDGHFENLMADEAFPVLLDGETLFQNYEQTVIDVKNILSTLLVQKVTDSETIDFLNSAFQAPAGTKCERLKTYAIQDHTDNIEVRYQFLSSPIDHHLPTLNHVSYPAHAYIAEIVEGYKFVYKRISDKVRAILDDVEWWKTLGLIRSRILLRDTLAYVYLLRKLQLPDQLTSVEKAKKMLHEKLGNTPYSEYEINDLLSLNIPYFFHYPHKKSLYDSHGHEYSNVFTETAIERLKKQFLSRSDKKMEFDCEILRRHIVPLTNN